MSGGRSTGTTGDLVDPIVAEARSVTRRWLGTSRLLAASGAATATAGMVAAWCGVGWTMELVLVTAVLLGGAGGFTLFESLRADRGFTGIGACALAVVLLLAVYVSGSQLLSGGRIAILTYLGYRGSAMREDILLAAALFVVAAGAFCLGEGLVAGRPLPAGREPRPRVTSYRPVFIAMILCGIVVTLLTGDRVDAETLNLRGQVSGQGVISVLQQTLPVGLAVGILHRHWGSWILVALSLVGLTTYLTVIQSRSMLLFIGVAAALRALRSFRDRAVRPSDVLGLVALAYVASVFIVAFGEWRRTVRAYGSADFLPWLREALPAPWRDLSAKGSLDTLDGLVLSLNVDRDAVGATLLDPLKGLVNLVPSQLWADKPEYLGPRITHHYTNFGGRSGIFLSGPGYLYVVYGGIFGMTVACLVLGVVIAWLLRRARQSTVLTTVIVYGLCRFMIGGDAFDLQYSLTILLSLGVGMAVALGARVALRETRGKPRCA